MMFTKRIHLAWRSFEQPADICHKIKISSAFWFAVDEDVDYVLKVVCEATNDSSNTMKLLELYTAIVDKTDVLIPFFCNDICILIVVVDILGMGKKIQVLTSPMPMRYFYQIAIQRQILTRKISASNLMVD